MHASELSDTQHVFPEEWDHDVPQLPSHPMPCPDLSSHKSGKTFFVVSKRILDLVGSAFGLLLLFPVLLFIALAMKLSSRGPVLFRQLRVGQYGKPFVFSEIQVDVRQ